MRTDDEINEDDEHRDADERPVPTGTDPESRIGDDERHHEGEDPTAGLEDVAGDWADADEAEGASRAGQ